MGICAGAWQGLLTTISLMQSNASRLNLSENTNSGVRSSEEHPWIAIILRSTWLKYIFRKISVKNTIRELTFRNCSVVFHRSFTGEHFRSFSVTRGENGVFNSKWSTDEKPETFTSDLRERTSKGVSKTSFQKKIAVYVRALFCKFQ